MYVDLNSRFTLHNEKKNLEKIISKRSYDFFIEKGESTKKSVLSSQHIFVDFKKYFENVFKIIFLFFWHF